MTKDDQQPIDLEMYAHEHDAQLRRDQEVIEAVRALTSAWNDDDCAMALYVLAGIQLARRARR